jgi:hypothetical protein
VSVRAARRDTKGTIAPRGDAISTFGWIAIGVTAWMAVALVVGLLIGGMIRRRDDQATRERLEHDPSAAPMTHIPAQGTLAHPAKGPRARNRGTPGPS